MSHLTRVLPLFPTLLLCTSSLSSQTATVGTHRDAKKLRDVCKGDIATVRDTNPLLLGRAGEQGASSWRKIDETPQTYRDQINAGICLGYIQGAVDAINLSLHPYSTLPLPPAWCAPKEATTDELIRVFLKYIDGHPEELSHAAADVLWRAMIDSYPCPAK